MPLTPIDVQQKTFGPELRGYNMDEVDDFLDEVVSSLKDYDQRVRDAQDRIRALESEVSNRGEDESAISRALVTAQKQADAIVNEAMLDAQRILEDARGEADQLRTDRETERMTLVQDIARMRATVADLKRRVLDLATSIDQDLDSIDGEASEVARELEVPGADEPVGVAELESVATDEPSYVDDSGYVVEREVEYTDVDDDGGLVEVEIEEIEEIEEIADIEDVERSPYGGSVDDVEVGHGLDPFGDESDDAVEDEAVEDEAVEEEAVGEEAVGIDTEEMPFDDEAALEDEQMSDEDAEPDDDRSGPVSARRPWERGSV